MKIRIQGNSIRFRLTKPEVHRLAENGYVEEYTEFGSARFTYRVETSETVNHLTADLDSDMIRMIVPADFTRVWPENEIVSLDHYQPVDRGNHLYLLLEKDFKCLTRTAEDQSEQYDHPEKNC